MTKIIAEYHQFHMKAVLSLGDFKLFENATIKRALDADGRRKVVEHLISKGYADWVQPDNKTECIEYERPWIFGQNWWTVGPADTEILAIRIYSLRPY